MPEWLSRLYGIIRDPKLAAAVLVTALFLRFSPHPWRDYLWLEGVQSKYSMVIGIAILISSSILVVELIGWAHRSAAAIRRRRSMSKLLIKRVAELDRKEKGVLREFYVRGQSTITMPINDAVVAGLLAKGVLWQVSSLGQHHPGVGPVFPVSIAHAATEMITPGIVGLPKGKPTQEQVDYLLKNRPDFAKRETEFRRRLDSF